MTGYLPEKVGPAPSVPNEARICHYATRRRYACRFLIPLGLPGYRRSSNKGLPVHCRALRLDHTGVTRPAFVTEPPMRDQGRQGEFEKVMLRHLDAAHNLARWLVHDPSMAEDVVQDAYERAFKYYATFRGGSSRAWLLQIVRNAAYSTLNAKRQRMEVSLGDGTRTEDEDSVDADLPDLGPDPDATLAHRQELAALDDRLNALSAEWRESLILREVEALSYKEMSRIMEVPIGTVMSRLARARHALLRQARAEGPQGVVHTKRRRVEAADVSALTGRRE